MEYNDVIFSLDIGTRTVIGVVGVNEDGKFKIIAAKIAEHKSRAMMDGQIHDIGEVTAVALKVKEELEEKTGLKFNKVSVAAAGRALKTKRIKLDINIDSTRNIDINTICGLEVEGIQRAKIELDKESKGDGITYYCVGHTVVSYYLNNYIMTSLLGHKGKSIGVDIIATFLPNTVIDSLYEVMGRLGLEISNLTLEPIAAINAAIPINLRLLNLVLVDIGAGTSDIAITQGGAVIAYAMVPFAGDEITEVICNDYLVDFNTAEKIKLSLDKKGEEVSYVDVLGSKRTIKKDEAIKAIEPVIDKLAETISSKIIEFNQKSPNAVFLVGGGSQIKGLSNLIAAYLKMQPDRVAIRNRDSVSNALGNIKKFKGPETITPLGIALTAMEQMGRDFFSVILNGRKIRMFNTKTQRVSDALIIVGFKPEKLIGKKGKDLRFQLNGEWKKVKGEYGKAASILVNGEISNLRTVLKNGDEIIIDAAEEGKAAKITIAEIMGYFGEKASVIVNGKPIEDGYVIKENDIILIENNDSDTSDAFLNDDEVATANALDDNSSKLKQITIRLNGKEKLISCSKDEIIFVDVFNYIDIDLNNAKGNFVLKLNGKNAAFTDGIKEGDSVDIYWE